MKPSVRGSVVGIVLMLAVAGFIGWQLVKTADVPTLILFFGCGGSVGYQTRRLLEQRQGAA